MIELTKQKTEGRRLKAEGRKIKQNYYFIKFFTILFIFSQCLFSCSISKKKPERFQKQFFSMDTLIEIIIIEKDPVKAKIYLEKIYNEFKRLDKLFTGYDSTGDIWKINNSGTNKIKIDPEILYLISNAYAFSDMSEGAFDISVWPLVRLWGFGFKPDVPNRNDLESVLYLIDYKKIKFYKEDSTFQFCQKNMGLDLGGIAKGYALDKTANILKNAGINNFLINAGGNIITRGTRENGDKWRIGIQHPRKNGLLETLEVTDCTISTSGDYERYFIKNGIRYHHIMNPKTGYPANRCISVTVIQNLNSIPNPATVADILSTTIFILGPDKGMQFAKIFNNNKVILMTPDFKIIRKGI